MPDNVSELEKRNRNIARRIAEEGMVLLENTGVLPLIPGKIALYGSGARHTIKGGKGSGDVNDRHTVTVEEGLNDAGFEIATTSWLDKADIAFEEDDAKWASDIDAISCRRNCARVFAYLETEHKWFEAPEVLDEDIPEDVDTAIYVIGRRSGEGCDRTDSAGDFRLRESEKRAMKKLSCSFSNVVVVINSGAPIETSFFHDEMGGEGALLYMGMPGEEAGNALADILIGKVSPSGKLASTWGSTVADWNLLDSCIDNDGNRKVVYNDDALPGYRGFLARRIVSAYPFGYGLSYAEFRWSDASISEHGNFIDVCLEVKNVSIIHSGSDVVELYSDIPNPDEDEPAMMLIGYEKTSVLAPGESERISIIVDRECLALWKDCRKSRVVSKGNYAFYVGTSCVDLHYVGSWDNYEDVEVEVIPEFRNFISDSVGECEEDDLAPYSDLDLIHIVLGDYAKSEHTVVGAATGFVAGAAGYTTDTIPELPSLVLADGPAGLRLSSHYELDENGFIINVRDMEGLEGGRYAKAYGKRIEPHSEGFQWCTCFPTGTLVAQSWNRSLAEEFGRAISDEMIHFGVDLWLAPGMNIQRNPLCGRNYEYYSEDPLLAGLTAASVVKGVQDGRCTGAVIKHFACNNFEDGRLGGNSIVSSKALYDIYLRAFEIAIREYPPFAIMTSYNKVNGVQSAESEMLCTEVLRNVWHYDGLVMSDWGTTDFGSNAVKCIKCGNDLIMPGSESDERILEKALSEGVLHRSELARCARRVLKLIDRCRGV